MRTTTQSDSGEAVRSLYRLGRQYAAGIRTATTAPTVAIALLAAPVEKFTLTATVMSVVTAWSVVYVFGLLKGPGLWYTIVDIGVLMLLCLGTRWLVPVDWLDAGHSWIMVFTSFACVAYQCHTELVLGMVATATVLGALIYGSYSTVSHQSPLDILITTSWSVVGAILSRALWISVRRGGVLADQAMASAERARTDQRVTSAIRADESALANALHDTAATTLLMVGVGRIPSDDGLLAAQARRDLKILRTYGENLPARSDLSLLLRVAVNLVPLDVDFTTSGPVFLPTDAAGTIAEAAGEALNNVVKHAMVDNVQVRLTGDQRSARVEIVDRGRGFDPSDVPDTRRGLRESVHNRMTRIDGHAHVTSVPGFGTTVRLEWADV